MRVSAQASMPVHLLQIKDKSEHLRNSLSSAFLACQVCQWRQLTRSDMYVCVFLTVANAFPSNKLTMWVRWSVYA